MFRQELKTGLEAQNSLRRGVQKLVDVVGATLGPRGGTITINQPGMRPLAINDGVTVAKQIILPDPFEDVGAQLVKEAAIKTSEEAGDGTTTSTILANAIFEAGLDAIHGGDDGQGSGRGCSTVAIKEGMDLAVTEITESLKKISRPILEGDVEKLKQIATISSNNDSELGALVVEAFEKAGGRNGIMVVEPSHSFKSSVSVTEGFKFDEGFVSPHFITNPTRDECVLENPYVFVTEKRFSDYRDLHEFFVKFSELKRPMLLISPEISGPALSFLATNHMNQKIRVAVVKPMFMLEKSRDFLRDVALFTGGRFFGNDVGFKMANVKMDDLGEAERVVVRTKNTTIIRKPEANVLALTDKIAKLRDALSLMTTTEEERPHLEDRIGRLEGKAAVISVAAAAENELAEKLARVDDAVHATRAAMEEGVLPGGASPLLFIQSGFFNSKVAEDTPDFQARDRRTGRKIVYEALSQPFRTILHNMGFSEETIKEEMAKVLSQGSPDMGYNALTGNIENLYAAGVVDPTKVVRLALKNAVSVASMLLGTKGLVLNIPDAKAMGL